MGESLEGHRSGASKPGSDSRRTADRDRARPSVRLRGAARGAIALIDEVFASPSGARGRTTDFSETPGASDAPEASGFSADTSRARRRPSGPADEQADLEPDLQTRITAELVRLCERTGAVCGVALGRVGTDAATVVAACGDASSVLASPPSALIEALLSLPRATDLAEPALADARGDFASITDWCAAASVHRDADGSGIVLLIGGTENANDGDGVRPRTLADLQASADALRAPVSEARMNAGLMRHENDVQRLDRLASLGELVTEIAHELRNPMVSLKTFIQLVPERYDDPDFRGSFREVVAGELARMERLLDDLLNHARPRPTGDRDGSVQIADELKVLLELLTYRCRLRGIDLSIDVPGALPRVAIAADAFRQIALNLLLNAISATPDGGTVRVHAAKREAGSEGDRALELCIDDSGPGIAPEVREQIFAPFYTTRRAAAGGLGLAISRRLAEAAGGTLIAEDGPEGGARLRLVLPVG